MPIILCIVERKMSNHHFSIQHIIRVVSVVVFSLSIIQVTTFLFIAPLLFFNGHFCQLSVDGIVYAQLVNVKHGAWWAAIPIFMGSVFGMISANRYPGLISCGMLLLNF